MLVNGDVPFLGYLFELISDLWVSFLASSAFLGAILSTLRIYGYTFEKIASNNFSCLSHAGHSCQRLTRLLFSGFMDIFLEVLPDL